MCSMRIIHVVVEILLLVHIYKKGLSLYGVSLKYEDVLSTMGWRFSWELSTNQLQYFKTLSIFWKVSFLSISLTQPNPLQKMVSLSNET